MDFDFTAEQTELVRTLTRILGRDYSFEARQEIVATSGWSAAAWERLVELGLTGLPFAEEDGGMGGSVVDLVAAAEVFGAHLLVEPWIASTVLAGGVLAGAVRDGIATPEARARLAGIAAGEATGALAHDEGRGIPDPGLVAVVAQYAGDGFAVTGGKRMVLHGADADVVVVSARLDGEVALFAVAGADARASSFTTIDGRRAAHLAFEATPAVLVAEDAEASLRNALGRAAVVQAAEAVGAMGELLTRTAEYVHTREQFGVAIGTFQALAHRLADMKIAHTKVRATLLYTTALAEAGSLSQRDVSVLCSQVGRLGRSIGESAIQLHGGVGMTDELPIGHLHKRVLATDALLGGTEYHARVLGGASATATRG